MGIDASEVRVGENLCGQLSILIRQSGRLESVPAEGDELIDGDQAVVACVFWSHDGLSLESRFILAEEIYLFHTSELRVLMEREKTAQGL